MSELAEALERLAERGAPGDAARASCSRRSLESTTHAWIAPTRRQPRVYLVAAALVIVVSAVAAVVGYVHDKTGRIERVAVGSLSDSAATPNVMTVLAVGVETRQPGADAAGVPPGKRLDALMLLRLNRTTGATAVLSLPRDLADADGNRLSASPSISPTRVVTEVERLTNVTVDHYLEFDYAAFTKLVDAFGGIRIPVAQPLRDELSGLHLDAGCVTLDGDTALAYARSRHLQTLEPDGRWTADPTGDLGRIQRQQQLLHAAVTQWRSHATGPMHIAEVVDAVVGALRLDDHFSVLAATRFVREWQRHDATLRMLTFPVVPATLPNGAVVLEPLTADVPNVIAQFTADDTASDRATSAPACS